MPSDVEVPGKSCSAGGRNQSTQMAKFTRKCGSRLHNKQLNHDDHKGELEGESLCKDHLVFLIKCD